MRIKKMNLRHIITAILVLFVCSKTIGQTTERVYPRFSLGAQTGLDIGAAVPFPLSAMGNDSKINAVPSLFPQLGVFATIRIAPKWTATVETAYKQVGIDAKARVSEQRFTDSDDPTVQINFRGAVEMGMHFSMLEVPVYAGYNIGKKDGRVILGAYYSYIFKADFSARPLKGVLTPLDNPHDVTEVYEPMDTQYLSSSLDNWDWGLLTGYEMKIFDRATLGARLNVGMKDIFKSDEKMLDYKMLHMRGAVVIAYKIFKDI